MGIWPKLHEKKQSEKVYDKNNLNYENKNTLKKKDQKEL